MTRIVYLHGFASGPASRKAALFRERLSAAGMSVAVPDLSEGRFEDLTLSGQLRVVERAAGEGPVVLIGSSMGGYLAALYAARHPEVEKLVLLAPAFCFARRWPEALGSGKIEEWKGTGFLEVFHYSKGRPARVRYALLEDAAGYEDYPCFHQPALIFHGRRDDVVPVGYSEEFARRKPNVRLEVLDSDHELLDVAGYMLDETMRFLDAGDAL